MYSIDQALIGIMICKYLFSSSGLPFSLLTVSFDAQNCNFFWQKVFLF